MGPNATPLQAKRSRMSGRLVLAGYGDVAARIARRLGPTREVVGVNRSGRWAEFPHSPDIQRIDLTGLGRYLCAEDTVIWLAPPPKQGELETNLESALREAPVIRKLIYLSTSGVYGDCAGNWVSENHPAAPQSARAKRRLSGEQIAGEFGRRMGIPVAIVRVPGIYGPGRLPKQRVRDGLPTFAANLSPWSNRIHAEDLAAFFALLLSRGEGVFNISDGRPGTITEYFQEVASCMGLPPLPEVHDLSELTPGLASYMSESRRMNIEKARALGYAPAFPDFRQALPECLHNDLHWQDA